MFNQHAKWLKSRASIPWRRPIASLNYLLSSHVWRQDHNGFSHQDPGFIDHVVNKKAEIVRVYLPARREQPAVGRRPLPAQPRLRQRHRRRQAARARLADAWTRPSTTAPAASASGSGPRNDAGDGARRGDGLRRRRPDPRDARRRCDPARSSCRELQGPGRQRRRPDAAAARDRAPPRSDRRGVRRALHDRPPGHLRLPRLPLADPPPHLPAHQPRTTSTCAATRRRARPPPRSTW